MNWTLSIPGKAFIAGEYLALAGGPALVAAIEPRFALQATRITATESGGGASAGGSNPFHPESLAGKLWMQDESFFRHYDLKFIDAHAGQGGFGGSTAEFALLHGLREAKMNGEESQIQFDLHKIWGDYRAISQTVGQQPSGADLIGQLNGYLTVFDRGAGKINQFSWLFQNLGFMLFRTNQKLATHEHLKNLGETSFASLEKSMQVIVQSLVQTNAEAFVEGVNEYATELARLKFVTENTQKILRALAGQPGVQAAKGCGAMGADVICVVDVPAADTRAAIVKKMSEMGCTLIANEKSLSAGMVVEDPPKISAAQEVHL